MSSSNPHSIDCFALLDDSSASTSQPRSRLYTGHAGTFACKRGSGMAKVLEDMQGALQRGQHAVGMFAYELGADLLGTAQRALDQPLVEILLFERCEHLSKAEADAWLLAQRDATASDDRPAGIAKTDSPVTEEMFCDAVARIHAYIEAGDTYQINYTSRLHFDAFGSIFALYLRLRERQPVPHGALIVLPDGRAVLSLSPELFVRHAHGELTAQPMKGTARATGNAEEDMKRAAALAADPKNRAENLMIVDLLRNDLGRIAALGSVQVPALFEVDHYGDVLQMTSTVKARLRDGVSLSDIFSALFPCGSITGAPKIRAMQIIHELEPDARKLYSGAIGWFDADDSVHQVGDFCMSVPIRTLELQAPGPDGVRAGEMGVGAGIVHDSVAADEYAECRLKARFLTGLSNDFELFETIHATHAHGCRNLDRHLRRLGSSAQYFGFLYNEDAVRRTLRDTCAALPVDGAYRLRLALNQVGVCTVQTALLTSMQEPVLLLLASTPTVAGDLFLRHKTTVRARYDDAWRSAEKQGAFDMLFFNTEGELTEGGRSNVFVQLKGRWYTPPLSAGLLPGVMREVLLEDPEWDATERLLTLDDLRAAQKVVVCNALRGALTAVVDVGEQR
jgi:para-aminobenzoate synthetase/4-amino-4-deoxychorismate lyase